VIEEGAVEVEGSESTGAEVEAEDEETSIELEDDSAGATVEGRAAGRMW
jgi:hypothetical protein